MRLTDTHERLLIALIALHSAIVGSMFIAAPQSKVCRLLTGKSA